MTAEIVLMNTEAVALAADSAVSTPNKIFNSANKIFMVAPGHAVGIMIYHNARFMGVPWEVVIKLYRDMVAKKEGPLATLSDYVEDFVGFLKTHIEQICPTRYQISFFEEEIQFALYDVAAVVDYEVQMAAASGLIDEDTIQSTIATTISEIHARLATEPDFFPETPDLLSDYVIESMGEIINATIEMVFEERPLTDAARQHLREIAVMVNTKFFESSPFTGMVFAGFGKEDLFPTCQSFLVGGVVSNYLKYKPQGITRAGYFESAGSVLPFAQKDMVISYMTGIHPDVADFILTVAPMTIAAEISELLSTSDEFGERTKKKLDEFLLNKAHDAINDVLLEAMRTGSRSQSEEILQTVAILPKDELAAMAESLVTLTSLRRRFSFQRETVGGPIDIALISKKDGFIWVKRKHYFDAALNVHYDPS